MTVFDLLVVGEINPDLILYGEDLTPAYGQQEKLVEAATLAIGSSSVIMACGAARLGLRTAFIGVIGDDVFGHFMLDAMQERGIDTSSCVVDPKIATGMSIILARKCGDRAILTFAGSISELKAEHIDTSLFSQARHLHISSYFLLSKLQPALPGIFVEARRQGLTTSLDTNWDPLERWDVGDLLKQTDLFLPNEVEAQRITKQPDLERALEILAAVVPTLAVKMGAEGGLARQGQTVVHRSPPSVDIVDTVGAGDSFDAGFLYGFLNHWPLEKSLRLALICGSLSARAAGGTEGQPTLLEAERWLENGVGW